MSLICRSASSTAPRSVEAMATMPTAPSSSTLMSAPVSDWMALITLPLGPITSPIFSTGISKEEIFGAVSRTSGLGSMMVSAITSRMSRRAECACRSASASTDAGMPEIFVSSWSAVMKSVVPATLKSMSPKASSAPRMSVRVTQAPSAWTRPMATPATGALIGTPASINDRVDPHTDAIELDPLDAITSDTVRTV